jgi:hypothetical protein
MAGGRIEGAGLRGVMRLTWVEDHLAHVLDHCETDEPSGTWTGLACQDHGLALGGDVDNATLRRLSAHGQIADLIWEPRGELVAEHGQLHQAAIQAAQDGKPKTAEQLWQQVQAIWSVAWSANYAALKFLQDAGLSRFSPVTPQRWVVASFEHHRGPHGLPHPHVHNIVITAQVSGVALDASFGASCERVAPAPLREGLPWSRGSCSSRRGIRGRPRRPRIRRWGRMRGTDAAWSTDEASIPPCIVIEARKAPDRLDGQNISQRQSGRISKLRVLLLERARGRQGADPVVVDALAAHELEP